MLTSSPENHQQHGEAFFPGKLHIFVYNSWLKDELGGRIEKNSDIGWRRRKLERALNIIVL